MGLARSHPCSCDKQSLLSQIPLWRQRQAERKQQQEQHHFLRLGNQQLKSYTSHCKVHVGDQPTFPSPYHSFVASGRYGEPDAPAGNKPEAVVSNPQRSTVLVSRGPQTNQRRRTVQIRENGRQPKRGPCQTCLHIQLARLSRSNEKRTGASIGP